MNELKMWVENLLQKIGLSGQSIHYLRLLILLILLILASYILFRIAKAIITGPLYRFFRNTSVKWDDILIDHKVLYTLAHIAPALLVKVMAPIIFRDFENLLPFVIKLTNIYLIVVGMSILIAPLKALEAMVSKSKVFLDKPISSYFQLFRIIFFITMAIMVLSELLGRSPLYFLGAFGAMTAILLLIFKDTILGLVASVQISANDMVKVGDWVEMPKFNADGDVIAINLNTVKIKNWDKTITTVPTYYFITDSFKNWRGMQESGGRRIKRSISINVRSIQFVDPVMRDRFKNYGLITKFIESRQQEIEVFNHVNKINTAELINGRRMTNIGVFRNYAIAYLKNHPNINQDMTLLVRHLSLQDRGLPLEIYCFTKTIKWGEYEEIQADIFDHLLAAATFFGLDIFQQPGGSDLARALNSNEK